MTNYFSSVNVVPFSHYVVQVNIWMDSVNVYSFTYMSTIETSHFRDLDIIMAKQWSGSDLLIHC